MEIDLARITKIRQNFPPITLKPGEEFGTTRITITPGEGPLNVLFGVRAPLGLALQAVCNGCTFKGPNCTGFSLLAQEVSSDLQLTEATATVNFTKYQKTATEKLLAIKRAELLAPCGVLSQALAMLI